MKPHVKNALEARGIKGDVPWWCEACSEPSMLKDLQCHHILYRSEGGGDEAENTILCCRDCHSLAHESKIAKETLFEHNRRILETIRETKRCMRN